jgi:sugar fermentation stimulation protein A
VIFDPPLQPARLLRRYKRFLADVQCVDGRTMTLHCANTGAMTGCADPGLEVWYSTSPNPARRYPHSLEVVCTQFGRVGVNTSHANRLIAEALADERLAPLAGYEQIRREVTVPDGSARLDFCLDGGALERCWVEVKSMTLADCHGRGAFPDAVSERALRHVETLVTRKRSGERAVLVFCAQHTGIRWATTADEIHPAYGAAVRAAADDGVEIYAWSCAIEPESITPGEQIPVRLS